MISRAKSGAFSLDTRAVIIFRDCRDSPSSAFIIYGRVANLEFVASLILATNSHRIRDVAHVAVGFSLAASRPSLWRSTGENCAALVAQPSCEIRRLDPHCHCDDSRENVRLRRKISRKRNYRNSIDADETRERRLRRRLI